MKSTPDISHVLAEVRDALAKLTKLMEAQPRSPLAESFAVKEACSCGGRKDCRQCGGAGFYFVERSRGPMWRGG